MTTIPTWWSNIRRFKPEEFTCKCGCGQGPEHMDVDFIRMLDDIRDRAGFPLVVTSGYRCPGHDAAVGGKGNHTTGKAADLACKDGIHRWHLLEAALSVHVPRIGIGKTFIHLDDIGEDNRPAPVIWLY